MRDTPPAARPQISVYARLSHTMRGYAEHAEALGLPGRWAATTVTLHQGDDGTFHTSKHCPNTVGAPTRHGQVTFDGEHLEPVCGECAVTPARLSRAHSIIIGALTPLISTAAYRPRNSATHHHRTLAEHAAAAAHATSTIGAADFHVSGTSPNPTPASGGPAPDPHDAAGDADTGRSSTDHNDVTYRNLTAARELTDALSEYAATQNRLADEAATGRTYDDVAALHAALIGADHPRWTALERTLLADHAAGVFNMSWLSAADTLETKIAAVIAQHHERHDPTTPEPDPAEIAERLRGDVRAALNTPMVLAAYRGRPAEIPDVWPRRNTAHSARWTVTLVPAQIARQIRAEHRDDGELIVSDVTVTWPADPGDALDRTVALFAALLGDDHQAAHCLDAAAALWREPAAATLTARLPAQQQRTQ